MPQSDQGTQPETVLALAKMVQDRLHLGQVPESHRNIFALGASSLDAADLATDIAARFNVVIPLRTLFSASSVGDIAGLIDSFAGSADLRIPVFGAGSEGNGRVISLGQEWRLVRDLAKEQPASSILPLVFRTSGTFSQKTLERALIDVLEKHEILRTTFDSEHLAGIVGDVPDVLLEKKTVSEHEQCADLLKEFFIRPFDLRNEIPIRVMLIEIDSSETFLAIAVEHIVFDGLSIRILMDDIDAFYSYHLADGASQPAPLPYHFADYARAQRDLLTGEYLDELLRYWSAALADSGPYPQIMLPCCPGRLNTDVGPIKTFDVNIREANFQALKKWLYGSQITPFQATLAALRIAFAEVTSCDLPGVLAPYAARDWWQAGQIIGCFADQIPIIFRGSLTDRSNVLDEAQSATRDAIAHADLPFGEILRQLYPFEYQNAVTKPYVFLDVWDMSAAGGNQGWLMGDCRWTPVPFIRDVNRLYPGISVTGRLTPDIFSLSMRYSSGVQRDDAIQALANNIVQQLISFSAAAE